MDRRRHRLTKVASRVGRARGVSIGFETGNVGRRRRKHPNGGAKVGDRRHFAIQDAAAAPVDDVVDVDANIYALNAVAGVV